MVAPAADSGPVVVVVQSGDPTAPAPGADPAQGGAPQAGAIQADPAAASESSDGIGAEELIIGGAGLAAGAVAGGVAGAVAGKAFKSDEDGTEATATA
ncbi:hypothetical protein GCM10028775_75150 [Catellatospora paridis]